MDWTVEIHAEFEAEFEGYGENVQDAIAARIVLLMKAGPTLGRPYCDTLNGSRHANMKELRCDAGDGVWRIAFAFDPKRKAILLAAGDKAGVSQKRFYKQLIKIADRRFDEHLRDMKGE